MEVPDGTSGNVCYKLCGLIHAQLVKAHAEINRCAASSTRSSSRRTQRSTGTCDLTNTNQYLRDHINVCYKLCGLIHAQLVKAHAEINRLF
ncbi:Ubiquitin-conjugating enzyme E2 O [Operophtera brumata]|uniref:Ubiquitin-conjugating enzyme E2 O n=1 Tax=Operophtera brumata TaxID=104452 RepID=A0A0L7KS67_OPEBR|nr:Ubiquitin-conjugating enzyme E2 O [Operophtera brumata]